MPTSKSVPLGLFLLLVILLFNGLFSDPAHRDSPFIGREVPTFNLPDLMDREIKYQASTFNNHFTLLNVWGTWCLTCKVELPYLTRLSESGIRIVGLYYEQDSDPMFKSQTLPQVQADVTQTLLQLGNPFEFNIYDEYRDLSFDLGVTGAPESFLIDPNGVIVAHHVGDINDRVWQSVFAPHFLTNTSNRGN